MGSLSPKAVFVFAFLLNTVLLVYRLRGFPVAPSTSGSSTQLVRRILDATTSSFQDNCHPLDHIPTDQCQHVHDACRASDTFIGVNYLGTYFCTEQALRPLTFVGLLIWLLFLFSTLGISASDFFTPNLGTIATLLGLDENVAGVTFLAFGNGSPDVFSTFSSMRAGSGSLAIGELLGAASFIVSCVVGSMCIIKPFAIPRGPFIRDVGFFTVAVLFLFSVLIDHQIVFWEAATLLGIYVFYVLFVVVGSWWSGRQARIRLDDEIARSEYRDDDDSTSFSSSPYHDDPNAASLHLEIPRPHARARALSSPQPPSSSSPTSTRRMSMSMIHSNSSEAPSPHMMPSFSLVGALEFRHVVTSLQKDAAGHSLSAFDSPVTPYAGGHYHRNRTLSRPRSVRSASHEYDPFDAAMGVQLNERGLRPSPSVSTLREETRLLTPDDDDISPRSLNSFLSPGPHDPSIRPETPTETDALETESQLSIQTQKRSSKIRHVLKLVFHALFPSLAGFGQKSVPGQIASLFAAPAILLLTVTLPVVVTPYEGSSEHQHHHQHHDEHENGTGSERLIEFEEEGEERVLIAADEIEDEMHALSFNKWLMAVQCVLGPLFCGLVLTVGTTYYFWIMLALAIAGLAAGTLVTIFAENGRHPASLMARCFMGFIVAVVWIMAIADEVVQVLQTFGFIFGLSDAIIGLTVFAVGNSLADLVANMSVAVFAPIMGFAACFGGPMLNILIGIGGSGIYVISHNNGQPYDLHFSKTLFASTLGLLFLLLSTMIVVPWNGYFLTRRWGIFLVTSYVIIMTVNVVVELKT